MNNKKYIIVGITIIFLSVLWYLFIFDNFHEVIQGEVYRSAQLSGQKLQYYINEKNIKSIINLRGISEGLSSYETELKIAKKNDIRLYNLGISSQSLPLVEKLDSIIEALLTADRPVLIHCHGGAHRSGFVSALALALETAAPISFLKEQFSWRYLVLTLRDHVGELFFLRYEKWLQQEGKQHSRSNLLFWIKNGYVDPHGNMIFAVDTINDNLFEPRWYGQKKGVLLPERPLDILVIGWAFYSRSKTPAEDLFVVIGEDLASKVDYTFIRDDVVKHFNLDKNHLKTSKLGWLAKIDVGPLSTGCHELSLRIVKDDSYHIKIDTNLEFCLN